MPMAAADLQPQAAPAAASATKQTSPATKLNYLQQSTTTPAAASSPLTTIATPHYHQHRLLLTPQSPLLFPSPGQRHQPSFIGHHYHQPQHNPALHLQQHHNAHHHHHQLHSSASTLAAATAAATAAGGAASNGSFQTLSSLSPDARACFTATYLCVLIVNNTWLDCNLLEMLCNGTTSSSADRSSSAAATAPATDENSDEDELRASQRNREQLEAFEMILNDLVAFAGGGRDELGGGGGSGGRSTSDFAGSSLQPMQLGAGGLGRIAPRDGIYIAPINLKSDGEPELPRQVIPPDEGGGGGTRPPGGNTSVVTLFYSDNNHHQQQQQQAEQQPQQPSRVLVARLNELPDDDDQVALLKQYFDVRRAQLAAQRQAEAQQRGEEHGAEGEDHADTQRPPKSRYENNDETTVRPSPPQPPGLIATWISRPLRDWSSYLFWSASSDPVNRSATAFVVNDNESTLASRPQHQQQQQQQGTIQMLRPIDRTESYNTIPTNQTSQKQQQFILELPTFSSSPKVTTNNHRGQQRQQQHQSKVRPPPPPRGAPSASFLPELADQMNIPLKTLSDLVGSPSKSSVTMAELAAGVQRQQSSTSSPSTTMQQLFRKQQRPDVSYMSTNLIRAAYETPSPTPTTPMFRDQQQQSVMFNRQPQQNNAAQYPRLGEDSCDCGSDFMAEDKLTPFTQSGGSAYSSADSCYRYCQARLASASSSSSTPSMLDQSSPATSFSTTSSTSLTTSGAPVAAVTTSPSGGKMNPLDVTFLLYTRRHRADMMNSDGQIAGGSDDDLLQQLQQSVAATTGSSSSISTQGSSPSMSSAQSGAQGGPSNPIDGGGAGNSPADRATANPNTNFNNIGLGEILDLNNEDSLSESSFNGSLPVKLIIHGFGSGGRRPWVADMVYKLLDYENVNVIVVDWEKGATLPNYVQAAGNTRLVGHKIASLIRAINARHGLTASSYHLIGFSLGAHVAGFAGMEIRNSTSISHHWVNRITGLDPASPLFEGYEADDRLDPSDAQFVDVIHSNGDGVLRGGFGSLQPMGHVDFYPNGGRVQVGCNSVLLSALSDIIYGKWQSLCNHRRALNFFMDSFEFDKCKFRSFNCDSYESYLKGDCFDCGLNDEKCSYMGYLANHSKGRGKMYLTTHEEAPFCANQFLIKIVGTKGFKTHWGKIEVTLVGQDGRNESFWLSATSQQSSNNHELPNGQKDLIQHSMQSLIVSHLALANLTHILLRYTKYRGWIYSGGESWSIDKVYVADSDGRVKSFCGFSTVLDSHVTTRLNLDSGNCTVSEAAPMVTQANGQQQISRNGGPTTPGSLITSNSLQQQQQQQQQQGQNHHQQSQQSQQPQPQSSQQSRTPRMYSSMMQPLNDPQQTQSILGNTFQMGSFPANDWHRQLGFGKFNNPSTPMVVR